MAYVATSGQLPAGWTGEGDLACAGCGRVVPHHGRWVAQPRTHVAPCGRFCAEGYAGPELADNDAWHFMEMGDGFPEKPKAARLIREGKMHGRGCACQKVETA